MEDEKTLNEEVKIEEQGQAAAKFVNPVLAWGSIVVELIIAGVIGYLVCRI